MSRRQKSFIILPGIFLLISFLFVYIDSKPWQADEREDTLKTADKATEQDKISCSVVNGNTLEVQGKGVLNRENSYILWAVSEDERDNIKRIVIREGITDVRDGFFSGWFNELKEVVIADSVRSIGACCFEEYDKLTTVDMGNGVREIGEGAFYYCKNLKSVMFPNELKNIEKEAFAGCISLQDVNLPEGLATIQAQAFYRCKNLCRITLPDSVMAVHGSAFQGCYNLEKIVLSANLKDWKMPGSSCPALKEVVNRSRKEWVLNTARQRKTWYVGGKRVAKIRAGETATARGKKYSIRYRLNGGKLVGEFSDCYEYGAGDPIMATAEKEGYYCIGFCHGWDAKVDWFYAPGNYQRRHMWGDLVLEPLFIKYRLKNLSDHRVKVILSDSGLKLPVVPDDYEIRYSEHEDMSDAKIQLVWDGFYILDDLTPGKRCYVEFRVGSTEEEDVDFMPETPWMGKKSILVS